MKSISFPKMFNSNSTNVKTDFLDCTKQNTLLLLQSEKNELFGDPYFGIRLKRYIYEQNNYILKDIIIDEIYTQLALFVPQVRVTRENIKLEADRNKLYCNIKGINQIDFSTETFNLVLYDNNQ